jgi:hypothetical protein
METDDFSRMISGSTENDRGTCSGGFSNHPVSKQARRTVAQALQNGNWIDDIRKPITINVFLKC